MKTKPLIISLAAVLSLGTVSAEADYHRPDFPDRARVILSTPIFDRVNEPRKECWTETVGYEQQGYRSRNDNGGAVIGDRMDGDDHYYSTSRPHQEERCQVSNNFRDVVVGYDVVYNYHGQEYATRLPYDPGQWLEVNVSVSAGSRQAPYFRNNSYHDDWR